MSGEHGETIDLAYIGRALQRLTAEVASQRDDMRVLTTIVLRHETTLIRLDETMNGVLGQMRAMVAQTARIVDRLRAVEDRVGAIEDGRSSHACGLAPDLTSAAGRLYGPRV